MSSKSNDNCPYKRWKTRRLTMRKRPCENGGKYQSCSATAKEYLEPPEAGKDRKESVPEPSEEHSFDFSGLQKCERIHFVV